MEDVDMLKKKKKKGLLDKTDDSELFGELDVDLDSDHPVHEKFVSDKRLREIRKKGIRKI